jgi:hypothetical protein
LWGIGKDIDVLEGDEMKDKSIRKLEEFEARQLSRIMGFDTHALDSYIDRWVEIKILSPKKIKSCGGQYLKNTEMK